MTIEVTLSTTNKITIPEEVRKSLGLRPGDKLLMTVRGRSLILVRKPKSFHESIRGLARNVYPHGYLRKERQSWR